ncbi:MAG: hypothetical protein ABSC41_09620 [Acidimicrobiales bacterium]|jgi:hypothetical protein
MIDRHRWSAVLGVAAMAALAGCGSSTSSPPTTTAAGPQVLTGVFHLTAGHDAGSGATGSYFRMINPGGTVKAGPFFTNTYSTATDKTYTLLRPGAAGGLATGTYQPGPEPPFDSKGNARADAIMTPQTFEALDMSISTNPTDPQSHLPVPKPTITTDHGKLTGQVEAISAGWNNEYFNQGSPKPGGAYPGSTARVSGTYSASTRAFVLVWASQVVGGAFNGFTGYWHLQGTFTPAG